MCNACGGQEIYALGLIPLILWGVKAYFHKIVVFIKNRRCCCNKENVTVVAED